MARRLRIEFPGALHHVINRGNYRRDLFDNVGTAEAFLRTLFEAARNFGWQVQAYVLMRNHYHLALATPEPTLGDGMHWLQSTMATRFNRFRDERGHLFQGRYKSLLIEDAAALARVVDYIHLNPVRAKVVPPELAANYRWSSLTALLKGPRPDQLKAADWLQARGGWPDNTAGIRAYAEYLRQLAQDEASWEKDGLNGLGAGWAIGTDGWRRALARDQARHSLTAGLPQDELRELRQARWQASLDQQLRQARKAADDLRTKPRRQAWKLELAQKVRADCGASYVWLAEQLDLGKPTSLRSYFSRARSA